MQNRTTNPKITKLAKNEIFVFGSNAEGIHAGGAAKLAVNKFGAIEGQSEGMQGHSYGINSMSGLKVLAEQVARFIQCALHSYPHNIFLVTEIGCGIAGFKPEQIAPLFWGAVGVENIHLPESFWKILNTEQAKQPIRGYKVFNPDFTCRGMKYEVGKEYKHDGKIKICAEGLHFCTKAAHCFSYYSFDSSNVVCEVEALGETQTHSEDSKVCTDHLRIIRQLTWAEVLVAANDGKENTGHSNSGHSNSGDRNSGHRNSGHSNSGDRNSGDSNSGNWNSGDRNSGDSNSGYRNSGYRNSGNSNSGDRNSGDSNSGDSNSGYRNSGYRNSGYSNSGYSNSGDRNSGDSNSGHSNSGNSNSGDSNSGNRNSGYRNSGNWNSGDRNSGDSNSGNWNSGNSNSGYRNSGDSNSGNWNSGDRNSGDSNSGYRNSGAFCTEANPVLYLFNKPTKMKVKEWENHKAVNLMYSIETTIWVPWVLMDDNEKEANPKAETCEGYLKTTPIKESWANAWNNWSDENKKVFTSLENFNASIFEEITGIKI